MGKHYKDKKRQETSCVTKFTQDGVRDMRNRKPFRTKKQKIEAKLEAYKVDGRWLSDTPVSYHFK